MSNNDSSPLLQTAHLRSMNYNTTGTRGPVHDPERNVSRNEEGFYSKYCSTLTVCSVVGIVVIMLILLGLLIAYK